MGVCCFRYTKIVNASPNQRKSKLKSCRSSIYQINKENINDVYDISSKFSSGYYGTVSKANFKNAEILFKLTHTISHCHSRGIVHRDIKAENILFEIKTKSKNDVKIIDFGLSRKKVTHNLHSIVGTRDTSHRRCLKGHTIENATSGHWECSSM